MSESRKHTLLAVIELGGYPNFLPLYQRMGYTVTQVSSSRKAIAAVKQAPPDVIVAEFNTQSDFRDRTSSLESLLAAVERHQLTGHTTHVIVFYEAQTQPQLDRLLSQFSVFKALPYPISNEQLEAVLDEAN